ncbi:phenylacetate--CoA ligase family protein [Dactylosporangium sucinum]|uniref:Coenzyme F390 synthetase n=1 Tax=Dactylosporangium sucinum TaxID=1424081 RepID=A0A917TFD2_9ACTN|nr:AMP-binding protein [Dactylosporangium sucinum]GGM20690.1 coenzyme F390 synthetase [Dactylosporangium sucinum]
MPVANPVIERMSRADLLGFVERAAVAAVRRAAETSPLHRWRYARTDLRPERLRTLDDVRRHVPTVTKLDLLEFQETLPGGGAEPADPTVRQLHLTSGTSGVGREIYPRGSHDLAGLGIPGAYEYLWGGLVPGDRLMLTIPYGQTMAGPYFQETCAAAGLVPINAFAGSTADRLRDLQRFACAGLSGTPSYVHRLTLEAREAGLDPARDLPSLKAIFLSGEPYGPAWAHDVATFWRATVCEGWGATQTLGVAMCTCERGAVRLDEDGTARHALLHGLDHRCWIEVLDPDGNPVGPGETGEIVVTMLRPSAQPTIRFRMADKVQLLEPGSCGCGRPLSCYAAGTIGRVDDMMKIRGMNVWPDAIDAVLLRSPVVDYRGRIYSDDRGRESVDVTIALESGTPPESAAALPERLRHAVKRAVGITVDISVVDVRQMPVQQFKSRRWRDDRAVRMAGATNG